MSYKGKFIAARTVEIEYLISEQNRKNSKVKLSIKALLNASAYWLCLNHYNGSKQV